MSLASAGYLPQFTAAKRPPENPKYVKALKECHAIFRHLYDRSYQEALPTNAVNVRAVFGSTTFAGPQKVLKGDILKGVIWKWEFAQWMGTRVESEVAMLSIRQVHMESTVWSGKARWNMPFEMSGFEMQWLRLPHARSGNSGISIPFASACFLACHRLFWWGCRESGWVVYLARCGLWQAGSRGTCTTRRPTQYHLKSKGVFEARLLPCFAVSKRALSFEEWSFHMLPWEAPYRLPWGSHGSKYEMQDQVLCTWQLLSIRCAYRKDIQSDANRHCHSSPTWQVVHMKMCVCARDRVTSRQENR